MRRFLPDGLAGRFALLLFVSLLAVNVIAAAVLLSLRDQFTAQVREAREIERLAAFVSSMATASPEQRRRLTARVPKRFFSLTLDDRPLAGNEPLSPVHADLRARIAEALDLTPERIPMEAQRLRGRPGRWRVMVSVPLGVGDAIGQGRASWSNLTFEYRRRPPAPAILLGSLLVLSLVTVLGVGLVFVRRLTKPLGQLATAARAAGRGDRTARVPEKGAREVREAAAAFNDMQARIARFDAERTRQLGAVGHDLRTPITSLRIRAEMLDDEARKPMVRTLDEMRVMADGLVAFARGEGDGEAEGEIDLNDLLARLASERGATFADEGMPVGVRGRPVALTRAVGNLIDNALRYGGSARVTLRETEGVAMIVVEDDGPGIAEERLADMLEPFVRGEASRGQETGGAGLGLSIARTILRAHGGDLALANREQGGLRATATLPL